MSAGLAYDPRYAKEGVVMRKAYRGESEPKGPEVGEPTKHPVGFGSGGAAGAVAGGAIGSVAGPVGTVAGAVIGGAVGARVGEGIAADINPTEEQNYWRERFATRPYVHAGETFDEYGPAYEAGYMGYTRYGETKSFEEAESELRRDYEQTPHHPLVWERAHRAAREAWDRIEEARGRSKRAKS